MTDEERVAKLEKSVQAFRLVLQGIDQVSGGFGEFKKQNTLEERLQHLEKLHEEFVIRGNGVAGSLKEGFIVNIKCP